jgi:hypothetical protein
VGNTKLMKTDGLGALGDIDERKRQRRTRFVRRRTGVLESSDKQAKKFLQWPASLEIAR